jgi:hypothetical protein
MRIVRIRTSCVRSRDSTGLMDAEMLGGFSPIAVGLAQSPREQEIVKRASAVASPPGPIRCFGPRPRVPVAAIDIKSIPERRVGIASARMATL